MTEQTLELLTMGRAAVDLYSDQVGAPLEEATTLSKYVGGCPANIAIGLSRLQVRCGMLTRVGDEAMGRFVRQTLSEEGVDVSHVVTDPQRLTALVLLGVNPPDRFPLIFYRENCADMAISMDDFNEETFNQTRGFLVTGTHYSRSSTAKVTQRAVRMAKAAGCHVVLDVDYRPVLWGMTGHGDGESRYVATNVVAERLKSTLKAADLVVGTEEELRIAVGEENIEDALTRLREISSATIVRKCGDEGCVVYPSEGGRVRGTAFPVPILNVLGAGDAFMSGFLRGWLRGEPWNVCASWANACGALVVSRHGCAPAMPYWSELQQFLKSQGNLTIEKLDPIHFALGRKELPNKPLAVLAFDHRTHFESLSKNREAIQEVKRHIFGALTSVADFDLPFHMGVIADHQYSQEVLPKAAEKGLWTGVCIEQPNSSPVEFLGGREASQILRSWPKAYTVKVLVRSVEDAMSLKRLWHATRQWGHQLLIEVIPEEEGALPTIIDTFYGQGIYPDWWKLPPCHEGGMWNKVQTVIEKNDPYCRGVLLLGQGATLDDLMDALDEHRTISVIKGFAVGRTIWGEAAEGWLNGLIDAEELKKEVWSRYRQLIETWCGVSTVTQREVSA